MPAINNLEEIDKVLSDQSEKISKTFSDIQNVYLVRMQFNDLLYNPQLTSSEIKKKISENLKTYLNSDTISLTVVLNRSKETYNALNSDLKDFSANLGSFNTKK